MTGWTWLAVCVGLLKYLLNAEVGNSPGAVNVEGLIKEVRDAIGNARNTAMYRNMASSTPSRTYYSEPFE